MSGNSLHWADYLVFGLSLAVSVVTGMISAWKYRSHASLEDFILGRRNMNPTVVAISLMASILDASLLLLYPTESYLFGGVTTYAVFGIVLGTTINVVFFVPTYQEMKLTSAYEYFELRFMTKKRYLSRFLRIGASSLYALSTMLSSGFVLYLPALTFSQVTGLPLAMSIVLVGGTCLVYTAVGGLRAVVWVDAIQMLVMVGGMLLFIIIGSVQAGGGDVIYANIRDGGRFNFDSFSFDPRIRYTLWTAIIGGVFRTTSNNSSHQVAVQRFLSVKNYNKAKRLGCVGVLMGSIVILLSCTVGLVMYGYYYGCDPIVSGKVRRPEQLIPYYMMDIVGHLHGLPGLYLSALFAAAMSTLSSSINAVCALAVHDFIIPSMLAWKGRNLTNKEAMRCCTGLSVILGACSIGFAFLPDKMGGLVLEITSVLNTATASPIFVLFVLGIFIPWANIWGAYGGAATAMGFGLLLAVGNNLYARISRIPLPLSQEDCPMPVISNTTMRTEFTSHFTTVSTSFTTAEQMQQLQVEAENERFLQPLHDVSFGWFTMYTCIAGVLVGAVVSFLTSGCSFSRAPDLDKRFVYNYSECCCYCKGTRTGDDHRDNDAMSNKQKSKDLIFGQTKDNKHPSSHIGGSGDHSYVNSVMPSHGIKAHISSQDNNTYM